MWGGVNSWADETTTTYDFEDGATLFTNADGARMTISNVEDETLSSKVINFKCGNANAVAFAYYDFSSLVENASKVTVSFDYYTTAIAGQGYISLSDATLHTKDNGGFTGKNNWGYGSNGAIFHVGCSRFGTSNSQEVNGTQMSDWSASTWRHVDAIVDVVNKTVSYTITDMSGNTLTTGSDANYLNNSASACTQIDVYEANTGEIQIDNLSITSFVDDAVKSTTYTVKYQDADGNTLKEAVEYPTFVGMLVEANTLDMATFYNSDATEKYVYSSGNTKITASENATDNVITLVFNVYGQVDYQITAVNGTNTLGLLAEGKAYSDGSTTIYWNKFKQFEGQWYETTGNYGKTITETGNTDVIYNVSDIAYFVESEDINKSRSAAATKTGTEYSGGSTSRHYANSSWWTDAFEDGGVFTLYFPYSMANASESTIIIGTRDADGNITESDLKLTTSSAGSFSAVVTIPAGSSLALVKGEYNSNILIDYLTLTPSKVAKTISAVGYATFCSDVAVDFAGTGLTAYVAKVNGNDVSFEAVEQVPAETGVLLKGAAGDYQIPAIVSATAVESALVGVLEDTKVGAGIFVLLDGDQGVGFYKTTNEFTVGAGTAYLPAQTTTARTFIGFDSDELTGISEVSAEQLNGVAYDLQGRRVVNAQKGLYIVNGKKVIK